MDTWSAGTHRQSAFGEGLLVGMLSERGRDRSEGGARTVVAAVYEQRCNRASDVDFAFVVG